MKNCSVFVVVVFLFVAVVVWKVDVSEVSVSAMEGDSVTLHTGVKTNKQDRIIWYFKKTTHIAQINGDLRDVCTHDQCKERFRDRLKLDHQTGSLTITNINPTDSGEYNLETVIIRDSVTSQTIFSVSVQGVSAAERDEIKSKSVKRGESVTLDPGVTKNTNDSMTWYYNDIVIAEISGDQRKICEDVRCKKGFSDRLKLDHQTGSLIITDTRSKDSGDYKLKVSSITYSIIRSFSVSVDGGLCPAVIAGICAAVAAVVLLIVAAAAGLNYCLARRKGIRTKHNDQANGVDDPSPVQNGTPLMKTISDSSPNQTETPT